MSQVTSTRTDSAAPMGVSGRIAAFFQSADHATPSRWSPLLGVFAVLVTPRKKSRRSTSPWPMC